MSLAARISQLERQIGTDDAPRHVTIWCGPHYDENWIEWDQGWEGNDISLYVRIPDHAADAWDFFTPERRAAIRQESLK